MQKSTDWHKADIKAAVERVGLSLREIDRLHGLTPDTTKTALYRPYPHGEARIAAVLGVHPMVIWPTRYDKGGNPLPRRLIEVRAVPKRRAA